MKNNLKSFLNILFKNKKHYGKIFFIIVIIISFLFFIKVYINLNNKDLIVTFFDIGQGDAALIQIPSGENILIDAGPDNLILNRLGEYLPFLNKSIDLTIFTHPDSDHITGFISVLKDYKVLNILENGDISKNSEIYEESIKKIEEEKLQSKANTFIANCGDKISFKDENLKGYVLYPIKNNISTIETNDNSIVFLLVYKRYSFLFTGDVTKDSEKKILFNINKCFNEEDSDNIENYLKNLTVLKVSHHGSNTASSEEFLKYIKPTYSIISAGENNRYNHPDPNTVNILKRYSKYILNTIDDGSVSIFTNGEDLEIQKTK